MAYEEALHVGRQMAILKSFGKGIDSLIILKSLIKQAEKRKTIDRNLLDTSNRIYSSAYYKIPPPRPGTVDTPGSITYLIKQREEAT